MTQDEQLCKVLVELPNHWATNGESMWAKPLGEDLYEIRNIPLYAYGLNLLDVVRAIEPAPDKKAIVTEVVRRSGHRTVRAIFPDSIPVPQRVALLESLGELRTSYEGKGSYFFAIDIEPEGIYQAVCERLAAWEAEGLLEYETCEPRVPGSLDDAPGEES